MGVRGASRPADRGVLCGKHITRGSQRESDANLLLGRYFCSRTEQRVILQLCYLKVLSGNHIGRSSAKMRFPDYKYDLDDKKYEARVALFKYLVGLYSALIAASLIGFEKTKTILAVETVEVGAATDLILSIILLFSAIIHGLLVIALSYHHKYYSAVYLEGHRRKYNEMDPGWRRTSIGFCVWVEHWWAVVAAFLTKLLAGTWYILPTVALLYLVKAFRGALP